MQQKVKRQLVFSKTSNSTPDKVNSAADGCSSAELDVTVREDARSKEDIYGEDMDTLEMNIEDSIQVLSTDVQEYSLEYYKDCRKKLISKVDTYRGRLEKAYSQNAKLVHKHREEVDSIRSFYQSILHMPTRTGRIIKAAHGNSSAAREVLEQAGLNYKCDGDKYYVC